MRIFPSALDDTAQALQDEKRYQRHTILFLFVIALCAFSTASLIVTAVIENGEQALKRSNARKQTNALSLAVDIYALQNSGALPAALGDITREAGCAHALFSEIPLDPWGNVYRLERVRGHSIKSAGKDGIYNTRDDIASTRSTRTQRATLALSNEGLY